MNFIFISPTFPEQYYQFPRAVKEQGIRTLGIAEDPWENLSENLKNSLDEYYRVNSLENYDEVYRAVAYFAHKYGKIDWLESNNEYWLEQDAKLRTDFNITSGAKTEDLAGFKFKSGMKAYYEAAGVPVARYHLVNTYEEGKKFVDEVGYPVVVKPDNGVGANATYKLKNDEDLKNFYDKGWNTQYIMEEFVNGELMSFDGIAGPNSEIVFQISHYFPQQIMDVVNDAGEVFYYTKTPIPANLEKAGKATIASFKPRSRFFHCEFFRLREAKKGLGEVGDIVGLEVNMRPPGGYTPDMMNYACDIDVYRIYAQMIAKGSAEYTTDRPYICCYTGRRDGVEYKYTNEEVKAKYGDKMCMSLRMPDLIGVAMGNYNNMARFKTTEEMNEFIKFVFERK